MGDVSVSGVVMETIRDWTGIVSACLVPIGGVTRITYGICFTPLGAWLRYAWHMNVVWLYFHKLKMGVKAY